MKLHLFSTFVVIFLATVITILATPFAASGAKRPGSIDGKILPNAAINSNGPQLKPVSSTPPKLSTSVAPPKAAPKPNNEPLPGVSGVWTADDGVVWIYYAEDKLADHATHVAKHFAMYPAHDKAWGVASATAQKQHRDDALKGVPTKPGYVRDEKMQAKLDYPVGSTEVTVMYCSNKESNGRSSKAEDPLSQPTTQFTTFS